LRIRFLNEGVVLREFLPFVCDGVYGASVDALRTHHAIFPEDDLTIGKADVGLRAMIDAFHASNATVVGREALSHEFRDDRKQFREEVFPQDPFMRI